MGVKIRGIFKEGGQNDITYRGDYIKGIEAQTVAYASCKGPYDQIGSVFEELFAWIGKKGYTPAGPPGGFYFNNPEQVAAEELLWELYCPLGGEVPIAEPGAEGIGVKKTEPREVAATIHKGPWEKAGEVYAHFVSWIEANGYEIAGPAEEVYLSDPKTPPQEMLTEVRFAARKK